MSSIRIEIAPSVLNWIGNVASLEGVDQKLLSHFYRWKTEEEQPTYAQIENLSKKIHIPLGYFFLKTPPQEKLPIFEFRTVNSTAAPQASRDLIDTYYQMTSIQNWMQDYLRDAGNEKLVFVGSCENEKNPGKIAVAIRTATGMALDWYKQSKDKGNSFNILRSIFESIGILVLKNGVAGQNNYRPLNIDEFRAFTLIDDYAPLVFINNKDTEGGKLFSLLHEIVHIWLGLHSFYNDNSALVFSVSPLETLCNAVAAELLVPNDHFVDTWNNQPTPFIEKKVENVARHFRCGAITIARRALDNRYINQNEYEKIVTGIIASVKNRNTAQDGGNYYTTAGSRYGKPLIFALNNSIKEGKTTYTEAFRLTNTNRKTFDTLVEEIRSMNE